MATETALKLKKLQDIVAGMEKVLVAFSGGVDSTFLLRAAKDVLGNNVTAVTAAALIYPEDETEDAFALAESLGVRCLRVEPDVLSHETFTSNPPDRCYWCKKGLFESFIGLARQEGLHCVIEGTNYDDLGDYRPGMRALAELGIRSPLREAGLTKAEIRALSHELGLPTWNKPSYACLASRFPYGSHISREALIKVGRAEKAVRQLGITQVRVRHYGDTARIEVLPEDVPLLCKQDHRRKIVLELKRLGYTYVTIDLEGYRTGSMNETLPPEPQE